MEWWWHYDTMALCGSSRTNCLCYCVSPKSAFKAKKRNMRYRHACKRSIPIAGAEENINSLEIFPYGKHICSHVTQRMWERNRYPKHWKQSMNPEVIGKSKIFPWIIFAFISILGPINIQTKMNAMRTTECSQLHHILFCVVFLLSIWHATRIDTPIRKYETFVQCSFLFGKLSWYFSLFISSICCYLNLISLNWKLLNKSKM